MSDELTNHLICALHLNNSLLAYQFYLLPLGVVPPASLQDHWPTLALASDWFGLAVTLKPV